MSRARVNGPVVRPKSQINSKVVTLRLRPPYYKRIKQLAKEREVNMGVVIREIIRDWCATQEKATTTDPAKAA